MESLAKELTDVGYDRLFLSDDSDLNRMWKAPDAPARFAKLATDPSTPAAARFLAGEVLARRDPASFPPKAGIETLAVSYADALKTTVEANRWGMPGELDEPTGQHLVALGKAAVPALRPLLADTTSLVYGGSKEAMEGNAYKWRVKDAAAFFIARIVNRPFKVDRDPAQRDLAIDDLVASLPK